MRILLLIGAVLISTSAAAAEKGQCDSKPFTLKKPGSPPSAQAAPTAKEGEGAKTVTETTPAKPIAKPTTKSKTVIGCKQPDAKRAS
jgi:hypothetical protein